MGYIEVGNLQKAVAVAGDGPLLAQDGAAIAGCGVKRSTLRRGNSVCSQKASAGDVHQFVGQGRIELPLNASAPPNMAE